MKIPISRVLVCTKIRTYNLRSRRMVLHRYNYLQFSMKYVVHILMAMAALKQINIVTILGPICGAE